MTTNRNGSTERVSLPRTAARSRHQLPLPPTRRSDQRRRDDVHQAVLQATLSLVDNPRIGFRGLTMEAVARRSHVSKATVCRWWPSKAHLLLDAYLAKARRDLPDPNTGHLESDLREHFGRIAYAFAHLGTGRTLAEIILAAHVDPAFGELFRTTLLQDRKSSLRGLLERACGRGEIRPDADLDVVVDMALGALHHRLLVSGAPIDGAYISELVRIVCDGVTRR